MKRLVFIALFPMLACSRSTLAPSTLPPPPSELNYAINIPDKAAATVLMLAFPNGVRMSPLQAQQQWNYTATYGGSPNVYYGETSPRCEYPGVGIVVAPYRAAALDHPTAAEWTILEFGVTYVWVGRFVYTAVATPGSYFLDPLGGHCQR